MLTSVSGLPWEDGGDLALRMFRAKPYLWPIRASILETNFGAWLFISC
jgi:hypothetical protein